MRDPVSQGSDGGEKKTGDAAHLQFMLSAFTPVTNHHAHETGYLYTDGIKYLADHAGAYWLLDLIFARQWKIRRQEPKLRHVQVWVLAVSGHTGSLTVFRDVADPAFTLSLPAIDFPLPEVTLHLIDDILMLPNEH